MKNIPSRIYDYNIEEQLNEVDQYCNSYLDIKTSNYYSKLKPKNEPHFDKETDVVIIGDGLGGSIISAYISKSNLSVVNIRPQKRIFRTAYSLAKNEFDDLKCIFNNNEIDELISKVATEGYFSFFKNNQQDSSINIGTNYISHNVLDHEIHVNDFFKLLDKKFEENNGSIIPSKFKSTQRYKGFNYTTTENNITVKSKLLISAMGENDPFNAIVNPNEKLLYACTYGAKVKLESDKLPPADILRTIDNSANKRQYLYELFRDKKSGYSTIYIFYISDSKADFPSLFKNQFIKQVEKYTESKIIEIDKLLYGNIPLSSKLLSKKRSAFDGHYLFGSLCGISPNSACGTQMFRYLDSVGKQLIDSVKNNKLTKKHLNNIKPDKRQLLSWSLEGLFTKFMKIDKHEKSYTPNYQLNFTFKQFSRISNIRERNDLLRAIFKPDVLGEMILKTTASGDGLQYLSDIASNNGGFIKMWLKINSIMSSYIKEELKEFFKHKEIIKKHDMSKEMEELENTKMITHSNTIANLKKINLFPSMLKHAIYYFNPFK